jgi:hypothetical protein
MLTDEEREKARAEYDALPGTPPDWIASRTRVASHSESKERIQDMGKDAKAAGMTWVRFTVEPTKLYVEGWKERPRKEAAFNSAYVPPEANT